MIPLCVYSSFIDKQKGLLDDNQSYCQCQGQKEGRPWHELSMAVMCMEHWSISFFTLICLLLCWSSSVPVRVVPRVWASFLGQVDGSKVLEGVEGRSGQRQVQESENEKPEKRMSNG